MTTPPKTPETPETPDLNRQNPKLPNLEEEADRAETFRLIQLLSPYTDHEAFSDREMEFLRVMVARAEKGWEAFEREEFKRDWLFFLRYARDKLVQRGVL